MCQGILFCLIYFYHVIFSIFFCLYYYHVIFSNLAFIENALNKMLSGFATKFRKRNSLEISGEEHADISGISRGIH